jgi:probable rRNA maturation factor
MTPHRQLPERRAATRRPKSPNPAARPRSSLTVITQIATARAGLPHARTLTHWAQAAYEAVRAHREPRSVTIRMVGAAESRRLNRTWRGKDKPTNVLSFPGGEPLIPGGAAAELGDLAICAAVVAREAREQRKALQAHWAHMVIHGVLHLLGHDHENDRDARVMEALEVQLLAGFGYSNPYA